MPDRALRLLEARKTESTAAGLNASNARQGIKTKVDLEAIRQELSTSERLQCPTGH